MAYHAPPPLYWYCMLVRAFKSIINEGTDGKKKEEELVAAALLWSSIAPMRTMRKMTWTMEKLVLIISHVSWLQLPIRCPCFTDRVSLLHNFWTSYWQWCVTNQHKSGTYTEQGSKAHLVQCCMRAVLQCWMRDQHKGKSGGMQSRNGKADLVLMSVWHERPWKVSQQGICGRHGWSLQKVIFKSCLLYWEITFAMLDILWLQTMMCTRSCSVKHAPILTERKQKLMRLYPLQLLFNLINKSNKAKLARLDTC